MDERKDLLLRSAARLYSLGVDLENKKQHIRRLVENGTPYDALKMTQAVQEYTELKKLWDALEAEHLNLRDEITAAKQGNYYNAVVWAVANGVTTGTSATTFSPNDTCTRGQVVTFLWRAFGKPEPKIENNPFTDVPTEAFYYKAVLWAVENGVTTGTSATMFSPNDTCTRGQVVTFLWRAAGQPKPTSENNPFTDVKKGAFYYTAVLWAVGQDITKGTSATTFSPTQTCTRGQVVTFLQRASAE